MKTKFILPFILAAFALVMTTTQCKRVTEKQEASAPKDSVPDDLRDAPAGRTDSERAWKKAEGAAQTENELFLGFRFGMTRAEVSKHFAKLRRQKKVRLNYADEYEYRFETSDPKMTMYLNFSSEYYKGKLYAMRYIIDRTCLIKGYETASDGDEAVFLEGAFMKAMEGKGFATYAVHEDSEDYEVISVKKNLVVRFARNYMEYINAPVKKLAEAAEKAEAQKRASSTMRDF